MRRIVFSSGLMTLVALTATLLRGNEVVDATRPANLTDVEALLQRIEQLERRVRELEGAPKIARQAQAPVANWFQFSTPAVPPPVAIPFTPHNHDGVLRADQVKIFMHYQTPIHEIQTAGAPATPVKPAGFQSGGITITR